MAKKYYAVKNGREIGIFEDWNYVVNLVSNFKGAIYKAFNTYDEASNFLNDVKKDVDNSIPYAYVDGSYDSKTERYSFGAVLFINNQEFHFKKAFEKDELSSMRNVAGEIKGAAFAIQYCLNRGIKQLKVYHDYEGISKWYLNEWQANLYGTKKYQEFANRVKDDIAVTFIKVKGHSNDKYNDLADKLAKEALGLK